MAKALQLRLLSKEKIAKNVWSFILERPKDFNFYAGQYVRIYDPVLGDPIFRDFTIASSPFDKNGLMLIIKEGISSYKKNLFSVMVDKYLSVNAPMGRFYFDDTESSSIVCLAGGVGVAPFYSMAQYLVEKKLSNQLMIIASFSSPDESILTKELEEHDELNKNIKTVITFTKALPKNWKGEKGRISKDLIKRYNSEISNKTFWICGSPSFVSDMEGILTEMNIELGNIRTEVFLGF